MSELLSIIKQAAVEAVAASRPVAVCYGRVTGLSPVSVRISQKQTVSTADFLVRTGSAARHDLRVGNTVALLQMQGGQQYLLLDKVVSG